MRMDGKISGGRMLTYDDVVWGYRFFLDREPENEGVIYDKLKRLKNIYELVEEFVNSEEFKRRFIRLLPVSEIEYDLPVEIDNVSDEEMRVLFKHVQDTWEYFGREQKYYSVLTWERFKGKESSKEDLNKFFESGRPYFERLLSTLKRNSIDYSNFREVIDFGCGAGRVTFHLCKQFEKVYGYDISGPHLQEAERYLRGQDIENFTLCHLRSIDDIMGLPRVDLIYSVIVLQHNPPPIISMIIREFMKALNSGGVAFFQLPTYKLHYSFNIKDYLNEYLPKQMMEMHVLPQSIVFENVIECGGRVIEVIYDDSCGQDFEGVSNTFLVQKI